MVTTNPLTKSKVWRVDSTNGYLKSPYSFDTNPVIIKPAQAFTVRLKHCQIFDKYDGTSGNDLVITTRATLGADRPNVVRVHYWQKNIPPGEFLSDFLARNIFVTDDYLGEDLHLELNVVEVNTLDSERQKIFNNLTEVITEFGAAFPVLMPYVSPTKIILTTLQRLLARFEEDTYIIKVPFLLQHLEAPGRGDAPLQEGKYVVFKEEFQGSALQMQDDGKIVPRNGSNGPVNVPPISYLVFDIIPVQKSSPQFTNEVIGEKIATLMTQLESGNANNSVQKASDFLKETLTGYKTFKDLTRYQELMKRKQLGIITPEEENRLNELIISLGDVIA